jgi:large subunit ribosomal protein L46
VPSITSKPTFPTESAAPKVRYQLRAGVVLSRPPLITRDPHPFEKAFFLYQRRLNERLALPFTRYFYIRKGTPADIDWKRKIKHRLTPARDIGVYTPWGKEGWNDELLLGAPESEPEHQMEALLKDSIIVAPKKGETISEDQIPKVDESHRPMPRITEADKTNDQKSLNRLLQRTLYLLVQDEKHNWVFPTAKLVGRESFHQAAERILVQAAGVNMNTWIVGNAPIGHEAHNYRLPITDSKGVQELGAKTFFMKARIMAGQVDLVKNAFGLKDFRWLSKEEISTVVTRRYFSVIENMLTER